MRVNRSLIFRAPYRDARPFGSVCCSLAEIAADRSAPHAARIAAASSLLDRGFGKPPQALRHIIQDDAPVEPKLIQIEFVKPAVNALDPFEPPQRELQSPVNIRRLK
ncbi:MAG: hypothetical protein WBX25_03305 [Rhodomicrobium sp.]